LRNSSWREILNSLRATLRKGEDFRAWDVRVQARRIDKTLAKEEGQESVERDTSAAFRTKFGPTLFDIDRDAALLLDERARRERAIEGRAMEKHKADFPGEIDEEPDRSGRVQVGFPRLPWFFVKTWKASGEDRERRRGPTGRSSRA
jgi:hypothetical protein